MWDMRTMSLGELEDDDVCVLYAARIMKERPRYGQDLVLRCTNSKFDGDLMKFVKAAEDYSDMVGPSL